MYQFESDDPVVRYVQEKFYQCSLEIRSRRKDSEKNNNKLQLTIKEINKALKREVGPNRFINYIVISNQSHSKGAT